MRSGLVRDSKKTVSMDKGFLILLAILLYCCLAPPANGGTIKTAITINQRVESSGAIKLEFSIKNSGDTTARNLAATLILADVVKSYDHLGNNPPEGEIHLKDKLVNPDLKPGKYVAVFRVDFEEQNGSLHRAYHFFNIPYFLNKIPPLKNGLFLKLDSPCINKKALWQKKGEVRLSMKNTGKEAVNPNIRLFLPDGFTADAPDRSRKLMPGEEKVEEILIRLEPDGKNQSPYHLMVWYDINDAHYSWNLKGNIRVEERPVYFKGYLMMGGVILMILSVVLFIRNRHGVGGSRRAASQPTILPR